VPLLISTLDSRAWQALSRGAKALYVALKRRYDIRRHNNGRIYLPQRQAEVELSSKRKQVGRWFRELQHYGLVVQTTPGGLGVDGHGRAPHWRLTELGTRTDRLNEPTREFMSWDGSRFVDHQPRGNKQNPGTQKGTKVGPKRAPTVVPKRAPSTDEFGTQKGPMSSETSGAQKGAITRYSHLSGHPSAGPPPLSDPPRTRLARRYIVSATGGGTVIGTPSKISRPIGLDRFLLSTIEVP
jgi:hypothetical protein